MTEAVDTKREVRVRHQFFDNANGHPAGGTSWGPGIEIVWQNGPERVTAHRGAFIEDLIDCAIARLTYYQSHAGKCTENAAAIDALETALVHLESRTRARIERGVEGTYEQ